MKLFQYNTSLSKATEEDCPRQHLQAPPLVLHRPAAALQGAARYGSGSTHGLFYGPRTADCRLSTVDTTVVSMEIQPFL